jgi:O-antigen/teichoic acid export membrane protein
VQIGRILNVARAISWAMRGISMISGFVTIRLIVEGIGVDGYGHVAFALALLVGLCALDLGFTQAISRFVARGQNDARAADGIFWAAVVLIAVALLLMQLLAVAAIAALYPSLPQLHVYGRGEFTALAAVMVVATLMGVNSFVFAGFQMYGYGGICKLLKPLLYVVAIVWLWWSSAISVHSALWANVLATLVANGLMLGALLVMRGRSMSPQWTNFPHPQKAVAGEMVEYSLRGWLFSLATVLISSGSVLAVGFIGEPAEVAHLQIALVLYTGISASITGGMSPLTTIVAGSDLTTEEGRERVATAAQRLVDESALLSSAVIAGLAVYGWQIVGLLLGKTADATDAMDDSYRLTLLINGLAITALPFFTFRFALVAPIENARYSAAVLWSTVAALALGTLTAAVVDSVLPMAVAIGLALAYRGAKAYQMGAQHLPSVTLWNILFKLVRSLGLFLALALGLAWAGRVAHLDPLATMAAYGGIVGIGYLYHARRTRRQSAQGRA